MIQENGRSMVETLGVLAIMGILSVVGISAYRSAMDKHKANTLISEAQKRAVIVAGQIGFQNREPSLSEFSPPNSISGGTFGDVITTGLTGQFGIKVSNVSKPVCENILKMIGDKTPIRRLSYEASPTIPITNCREEEDFVIVYNNDMKGKESDTEYATDESSCKTVCGKFNPNTHLCEESDCNIPTNPCTNDNQCNAENECMVCDTEAGVCKNACERVEYIESTGSQWIDTGFKATGGAILEFEAVIDGFFPMVGSHNPLSNSNNGYNRFQAFFYDENTIQFNKCEKYDLIPYSGDVTAKHHWYYNAIGRNRIGELDGENYINLTNTTCILNPVNNVIVFYTAAEQIVRPGKIYWLKITDANYDLVRDLIPVKSPKGNCLFNRVADENGKLKLYCSETGTDFVVPSQS